MPVAPTAANTLGSMTPFGGKKKLVTNNPIEKSNTNQSDKTLLRADL